MRFIAFHCVSLNWLHADAAAACGGERAAVAYCQRATAAVEAVRHQLAAYAMHFSLLQFCG